MSDKRPATGEQMMGLYPRELRRIPQMSREEEQEEVSNSASILCSTNVAHPELQATIARHGVLGRGLHNRHSSFRV